MPAQPCVNHPKELTFVRCGRCDVPICVKCMVDSPVGKKCRGCATNRTHVTESSFRQVAIGFAVGTAVAIPAAWICGQVSFFLLSVAYGAVVAEVVLRAGQRRRSLAMQAAAGLAVMIGGLVGKAIVLPNGALPPELQPPPGLVWSLAFEPYWLVLMGIAAAVAVSRVRFW